MKWHASSSLLQSVSFFFFLLQAVSCGIVESILNWVRFKAQTQLNKKCSAVKHTRIKGIPKLDDANDAGMCFKEASRLLLVEF